MPRREYSPDHHRLGRLRPESVVNVLVKDEYWTLAFLRLFLARIDRIKVDDPATAHLFALVAPELAERVPTDAERGGYGSLHRRAIWTIYSHAVYACACRTVDRMEDSREHFARALRGLERIREPPAWLTGQVHVRFAILLLQSGHSDGLTHLDRAETSFRRESDADRRWRGLATVLTTHGAWKLRQGEPGAARDFAAVMKLVDRTTPDGQRRFDQAFANLLRASIDASTDERLAARHILKELRRRMPRGARLRSLYVRWSKAQLEASLGFFDEAIRDLEEIRAYLLECSTSLDFALASIDLILALMRAGSRERSVQLAHETRQILIESAPDEETLDELLTLLDSRSALAEDQLSEQRRSLVARRAA